MGTTASDCEGNLPMSEFDKLAATFTDELNEETLPELSFEEAGTSFGYVSLRREETEDRDGNVRVTTASYSYELDRYHKNAMLILHISSYEGSYSTVEKVKNTFEKFRFEIDIHNNVTGDELRTVCAQFFSRDFTEYGAAAVVILAPTDVHGSFLTADGNFTDQDIRHHFNHPLPTLLGKPKIFICQADNWPSNLNGRSMQPDSDDVMEIYCRANIADSLESDAERLKYPLTRFCHLLERSGDREDMLTINQFWLAEMREHVSPRRFPFMYDSTLLKKLKLWRNV